MRDRLLRLVTHYINDSIIGRLVTDVSIYTLGEALTRGVSFLLFPMYLMLLGAEEFGMVGLLKPAVWLVSTIGSLGLTFSIVRFTPKAEYNERQALGVAGVAATIASTILTAAVIALYVGIVDASDVVPPISSSLLLPLALSVPTNVAFLISHNWLRARESSSAYVVLAVAESVSRGIVTIALLYIGAGVAAVFWGKVAGCAVAIGVFGMSGHRPSLKLRGTLLIEMLRYGLPVLPHKLSLRGNDIADRYILSSLLGPASVGVYYAAYKVAQIVPVVAAPVTRAWTPFIYNELKEDSPNTQSVKKGVLGFTVYVGTIGYIVSATGPLLLDLLVSADEYAGASKLIPILVLGVMISVYYQVGSFGITLEEKTKYLPQLSIPVVIANVILNFLLIPIYGVVGAAFATVISNAALTIAGIAVSNYIYPFPMKRELALMGLFLIAIIVTQGWIF